LRRGNSGRPVGSNTPATCAATACDRSRCGVTGMDGIVIGISRWREGVRRIRFFVARCVTHVTRLLHMLEVTGREVGRCGRTRSVPSCSRARQCAFWSLHVLGTPYVHGGVLRQCAVPNSRASKVVNSGADDKCFHFGQAPAPNTRSLRTPRSSPLSCGLCVLGPNRAIVS
jgi:hypothetical protein